jgi:hypothetical protein
MMEVFGVKYPIMLTGMAFGSLPKLVAAVSEADGLGTYNSVANTPEEMKEIIKEIRSLTDKPFSVNFTLLLPNARENAEMALEEKVPILNYALGKADWMIKAAHEYGGKGIATVTTERHVLKAEGKLSMMKAVSSAMKVKKELDVPIHKMSASGLKQKDRGVTRSGPASFERSGDQGSCRYRQS